MDWFCKLWTSTQDLISNFLGDKTMFGSPHNKYIKLSLTQLQQKLFSEKGLFSTLVQIVDKNPETAAMFHQILPSRQCRNVQYIMQVSYTLHIIKNWQKQNNIEEEDKNAIKI